MRAMVLLRMLTRWQQWDRGAMARPLPPSEPCERWQLLVTSSTLEGVTAACQGAPSRSCLLVPARLLATGGASSQVCLAGRSRRSLLCTVVRRHNCRQCGCLACCCRLAAATCPALSELLFTLSGQPAGDEPLALSTPLVAWTHSYLSSAAFLQCCRPKAVPPAGGMDNLVRRLRSGNIALQIQALNTLEAVCKGSPVTEATRIVAAAGGVPAAVRLLCSRNKEALIPAVSLLSYLSLWHRDEVRAAIEAAPRAVPRLARLLAPGRLRGEEPQAGAAAAILAAAALDSRQLALACIEAGGPATSGRACAGI